MLSTTIPNDVALAKDLVKSTDEAQPLEKALVSEESTDSNLVTLNQSIKSSNQTIAKQDKRQRLEWGIVNTSIFGDFTCHTKSGIYLKSLISRSYQFVIHHPSNACRVSTR
jgi:hypothetical protein